MAGLDIVKEVDRQLVICNACRYCEGFCPVFRAIETRRNFKKQDVFYLSNLCHDCRACYYACMFIPPHEFALNIPQILSEARIESYRRWSWPKLLANSFTNERISVSLACFAVALIALLSFLLIGPSLFAKHLGPGAFYELIPYPAMVLPALALVIFGGAIWLRGGLRFWSETGNGDRAIGGLKAFAKATGAALGLRHLGGGGPGCSYPDEPPSSSRRIYHSLVFWGFIADFISTTLAFIFQDFFHILPPYTLTSAPVIFGSVGGVALIIGAGGLIGLKIQSDRIPSGKGAYGMDYTFLAVLGLTALTGMMTLIFRATSALGIILAVHLGLVAALFVTAPYGKFVHALYRSLALIRYYFEQDRPHQEV